MKLKLLCEADIDLRKLERQYQAGDPEAVFRALRARQRMVGPPKSAEQIKPQIKKLKELGGLPSRLRGTQGPQPEYWYIYYVTEDSHAVENRSPPPYVVVGIDGIYFLEEEEERFWIDITFRRRDDPNPEVGAITVTPQEAWDLFISLRQRIPELQQTYEWAMERAFVDDEGIPYDSRSGSLYYE